jgi:hypothetical protein
MYGYAAVLAALRLHAQFLLAKAPPAERDRLAKVHAEHILRNRAKLLVARLGQTDSETKRREILRQALLGA